MTTLSPAAIRERVFVEVERLRNVVQNALTPGQSNVFSWMEAEFWVDRSRCLALGKPMVVDELKCENTDRVPDSLEHLLKFCSPRHATNDAWQHVRLLKAFIRGSGPERKRYDLSGDFLNFAVIQPLVNPAFASLFWLGLNRELDRARAASRFLGDGIGAMAFDMATYPASRSEAPQVRDAQVQFVAEYVDGSLPEGKWRYANDEDWARYCAELLGDNKAEWVFARVANALGEP
jgi:hypothetical protein